MKMGYGVSAMIIDAERFVVSLYDPLAKETRIY